ncbi:MAG TPA: PDZ domain-containing protein [Pyrinomonadaceae bacterium]|nr:PDZ domain-containing protein [Pyrinomonadaceae bacterium]
MMSEVRRLFPLWFFVLALSLAPPCVAQESAAAAPYRISYTLSMPRPETHLFEVRIDVEATAAGGQVDFQMPRWSPGRYAVFDFAKNVQEARAETGCATAEPCEPVRLAVTRVDTQTWRVQAPSKYLTFRYKVFADDLSGTFSQLDRRHGNYNGHSVFMYVVGHKPDPVALKIIPPAGWKAVNGYTKSEGQLDWDFPNYDVLADAPTEIAPDFHTHTFEHEGKTYRVIVHSFGDEGGRRASLAKDVERVVRAQTAMMGPPEFDGYAFIFHFDPTATRGDGMEHLTSTQIIETGALADRGIYDGAVGTASHEFFHVWNVKRLRPAGLGPWDFTRPVETRGLWIAEGLTNYYGALFLRRAGIINDEQLLNDYAGTITGIENAPGSRLMSAEDSSLLASFLDRGTSDQRTNLGNTAISYYPKGETLGLVLDLIIRGRTRGRASLDDVMRRAYEEFYVKSPKESYYLRGRGYTTEEFARVASEVAGFDLSDFFARHVRGVEPPPYAESLAFVGLRFTRVAEQQPFDAGISLDFRDPQPRVSIVRHDSPAEAAGIRQGDVLLAVGKTQVTPANWRDALNAYKAGERVPVTFRRARQTLNAELTLPVAPERYAYRIGKDDKATPEARALREAWLTGKR